MRTLKKQKGLRPTTGKVREALFDILRARMEDARFLDLYAGTGAVGINALNEGAAEVVFVEENKGHIRKIQGLLEKHHISDRVDIANQKAIPFINRAEEQGLAFDIIFLDPPYHTDEIINALTAIGRSSIIKQTGIVIAEHFTKRTLPDIFDRLHKVKTYTYGDSVLSLFEVE
ncbi:MAG: 16S rRNA (guanine(966)-N(2))-methyltransferase RsmD [Nitrospirae bacterium]|nr:16S rRNA (guanine(966)-N(2))-methyltransferase RsmD [Nitrospirota bacterium]